MSVSPTGTEHGFLALIWLGSQTLACISVVMATALIVRHAINERRAARRKARKAATAATMQAMLTAMRDARAVTPMDIDLSIAVEIAIEWLRNLSGKQAEDITTMLRALGCEAYLSRALPKAGKGEKILLLIYCSHDTTAPTLQHLVDHCTDPDPDIQIVCLRGLAKRGACDALAEALKRLDLSSMKSTLVLADIFMKLGDEGNAFLIDLMGDAHASTEIRTAAIMALGHNRTLDAVSPLIALCRMPDIHGDIRAQALNALGYIGDHRAETVILEGLDDAEIAMRVNAVRAASRLKCHSFIPKLAVLLDDPAWWVRFRAAQALNKIEGVGGVILGEVLQGQDRKAKLVQNVLDESESGAA
ncbi:HEAT repeat domain-containing protein [Propionivibrio sp.]|uniref:HEAT repeat domain-containing protein n=1 Tax=Propionivibrio sp. TaxID=2212460 RepID=UPI00263084AB|nr:HEAT repeat domain-containing protein [Propionivibrio sp.]